MIAYHVYNTSSDQYSDNIYFIFFFRQFLNAILSYSIHFDFIWELKEIESPNLVVNYNRVDTVPQKSTGNFILLSTLCTIIVIFQPLNTPPYLLPVLILLLSIIFRKSNLKHLLYTLFIIYGGRLKLVDICDFLFKMQERII